MQWKKCDAYLNFAPLAKFSPQHLFQSSSMTQPSNIKCSAFFVKCTYPSHVILMKTVTFTTKNIMSKINSKKNNPKKHTSSLFGGNTFATYCGQSFLRQSLHFVSSKHNETLSTSFYSHSFTFTLRLLPSFSQNPTTKLPPDIEINSFAISPPRLSFVFYNLKLSIGDVFIWIIVPVSLFTDLFSSLSVGITCRYPHSNPRWQQPLAK